MSDCRRYNQSGQYITTRVIAHKFRDEKFVSVSYNELDENEEGEEVNFVAADEARWTIDHPPPKRPQVIQRKKGDYIYMVHVKQDANFKDTIHSRAGTYSEIGHVINFYVDPGKSRTETIWCKYRVVWRQSQLGECVNADEFGDLV